MEAINSPQGGEKPVLLLDVDGVLIVVDEEIPDRCPSGYKGGPRSPHEFYNPQHGEWIKELLPDVDLYWLTSHVQDAHGNIGQHLGLPEAPWVNFHEFERQQWREEDEKGFDFDAKSNNCNQARRVAIETFFGEHTIIWVDDSLTPKDFQWGMQRQYDGAPTLLMKPDSAEGLQHYHIDRAKAWLGQLAVI
jgi:hypothetical protein